VGGEVLDELGVARAIRSGAQRARPTHCIESASSSRTKMSATMAARIARPLPRYCAVSGRGGEMRRTKGPVMPRFESAGKSAMSAGKAQVPAKAPILPVAAARP